MKETYIEIYKLLEQSADYIQKGFNMQHEALAKLIDAQSRTDRSASAIINNLLAPDNGDIYDMDQLAEILKVSKSTLYKWVKDDKIPFTKPNSGKIFFYKHQITEFLNK